MKPISKFIKGILLMTLFISIFSLNIQPILNNHITEGEIGQSRTEKQYNTTTEFADYFTLKAFAESQLEAVGANQDEDANQTAATEDTQAPASGTPDKPTAVEKTPIDIAGILKTVAKASTYVNSLFNPLIHFFTFNIGNFLGNDYIFAGPMSDMLHNIWVVSRNIVNIIFVLILLFLAVRHIFGGEEGGNTDLKKTLPMFVIMLIAINFSWLAGKVILDAANVATNVVFQIPAGVQGVAGEGLSNKLGECKPGEDTKPPTGACMPSAFYYPADSTKTIHLFGDECDKTVFDDGYAATYPTGKGEDGKELKPKKDHEKGIYYQTARICWKKMDISAYNQNNASYFLSFSMARVQNLTLASTDKDIDKVAIGVLFSLIMQIVYLAAFLALYLALIIRVAALWFLMAFSPFLVLMHYLTKDLNVPGSDKFSIKAFVNWAFVPAAVGAVWSVGFIMITTGQTMTKGLFATLNQGGEITSSVFSMKSFFMGMESWQQFIWLIMTIGIIWIGTFAALSKLPVVGAVVGKIDDYGKRAAKVIGSAPMWAPIMPLYDYKTGKMDWSKRMSIGKLSPVRYFETMKSDYLRGEGGMSTTDKFSTASQNLKNITRQDLDILKRSGPNNGENYIKALNSSGKVNISQADVLRNDGKSFKRLVEGIEGLSTSEKNRITAQANLWAKTKGYEKSSAPADKGKQKIEVKEQNKTQEQLKEEADAKALADKRAENRIGTTPTGSSAADSVAGGNAKADTDKAAGGPVTKDKSGEATSD